MDNPIARLGEHVNTDNSVRSAVRGYINELGAPFTLRDIYVPLGISRHNVNRELQRMMKKGLLTRYQIPYHRDRPQRSGGMVPGAVHKIYLYSLAEGYE